MSEIFAGQLTAVANAVLAVFAIVTAVLAGLAFRKQAGEVSDQAEMLELQRRQLAEQEKTSAGQAEVLALQAAELRESLEERKREVEERRRGQASTVTAWFTSWPLSSGPSISAWGAAIRNASDLPVFDVRVFFHFIAEPVPGLGWEPVPVGSSTNTIRVLAPQTEERVRIPDEIARQMDECSDKVYAVSITFTDAAGNRWERDPRGALKPLS